MSETLKAEWFRLVVEFAGIEFTFDGTALEPTKVPPAMKKPQVEALRDTLRLDISVALARLWHNHFPYQDQPWEKVVAWVQQLQGEGTTLKLLKVEYSEGYRSPPEGVIT